MTTLSKRGAVRGSMLALFSLMFSLPAVAGGRDWKRIIVPGAHCGDGSDYPIFVSVGDPAKIAFDIMGGGACWSFETCYGPAPHTLMHAVPTVLESGGFVSTDPKASPVHDHTIIYFPYCTGDVHAGEHVATYDFGRKVHHEGKTNFELALNLLVDQSVVDFAHARRFVLYGYSAGSLGALFHSFTVEPFVKDIPEKFLIADAPGLHFGTEFWDKFTPLLLRDFQGALGRVGFDLKRGQGNVAGVVPAICNRFKGWKVGVLQGARDVVMSRVFGAISQDDHEKLIFSAAGLYGLTEDPTDDCSAWVPKSAMHTFLVTNESAAIKTSDGTTGMDFLREVLEGRGGKNHR